MLDVSTVAAATGLTIMGVLFIILGIIIALLTTCGAYIIFLVGGDIY